MEPQPAPAAPGVLVRLSSHLDWYWTLSPPGRTAFWATFGGWALDAYNQMTVGFVLPAVTAAFALPTTQAGLLATVGTVTSAVGGAMAGALADAVGRVRSGRTRCSRSWPAAHSHTSSCWSSSRCRALGLAASGPRARCLWRSTPRRRSAGESSGPSRAPGRSAMPAS
jgi:hypothetical protein